MEEIDFVLVWFAVQINNRDKQEIREVSFENVFLVQCVC